MDYGTKTNLELFLFVCSLHLFICQVYICDSKPSSPELMSEFMKDCPLFVASVQVSFS